MLRRFYLSIINLFLVLIVCSQTLKTPVDGGNRKAFVGERIGITDVRIDYDRPAVKGREGQIWGKLVGYGFVKEGFGTSKGSPWRAGANENTTIEFSTDVEVEGKKLPAGKYGLFMAMAETEATVIFSKNYDSWGSYFYDQAEDALRVTVKTQRVADKAERLKYEFTDQKDHSAVINLHWEYLRVPFAVSVDYIKTQLESFRRELRSDKGFNSNAWVQAVNFALENNTNLEEALVWSDYAMNGVFVGQKNFTTLSARAAVLSKLGRTAEADSFKKAAMPLASMMELHNYGRSLIAQKKPAEALDAFKLNASRHPNQYTTSMGLARGYAANGDFKNAKKHLTAAAIKAPDKGSRDAIEGFQKLVDSNKDFN